jgi:hypothetical protein
MTGSNVDSAGGPDLQALEVVHIMQTPSLSWGLMTVTSFLLALAALWVGLTPAADQTELAGRTWEEFAQQDPEVAALYTLDLVILGTLGAGFGLIATVVSFVPYRRGERWAWFGLWLFPLTTGAMAVRMLADQYAAWFVYAGLAGAAIVALLLQVPAAVRSSDPRSQA